MAGIFARADDFGAGVAREAMDDPRADRVDAFDTRQVDGVRSRGIAFEAVRRIAKPGKRPQSGERKRAPAIALGLAVVGGRAHRGA